MFLEKHIVHIQYSARIQYISKKMGICLLKKSQIKFFILNKKLYQRIKIKMFTAV